MTTQATDLQRFDQQAGQIRTQVAAVLTKWGLLPRFTRWRLTQDPETGMVVLFGVLDTSFIASQAPTPFSNYFDPRLLHDLAAELQLEVISCNSDGLLYAFILNHGQLGRLPTHVDYPYINNGKLVAKVVYSDDPPIVPTLLMADAGMGDEPNSVQEDVAAFLRVFEDTQSENGTFLQVIAQNPPEIVLVDVDEFNRKVAEYKADQQRINQIEKLLHETTLYSKSDDTPGQKK